MSIHRPCSTVHAGVAVGRLCRACHSPTDLLTALIADLDLSLIETVRNTWQFYRDRRPESYGAIVAP